MIKSGKLYVLYLHLLCYYISYIERKWGYEKTYFEIDIKYNSCLIDAKSLLGVMNIGLKNKIKVCYGGANENFEKVVAKLAVA